MALFGWGSGKAKAAENAPLDTAIRDMFDPPAVLRALDQIVPKYLESVDRHELVYPACKRTPADPHGSVRSIWEHTRLEALRYVVMVPGRDAELLVAPARQPPMMDAFLRQQAHENTVIDFTGVATEDIGTAIIAGFNWLNHCASLAGVQREKVARTLTSFRKVVRLAQQWWETEGAAQRSQQMLAERQKPPLMLYLVWSDYTRLAKEVAIARAMRAPETDRETMNRLEAAQQPEDLGPPQPAGA
jgi:hypothetical protein